MEKRFFVFIIILIIFNAHIDAQGNLRITGTVTDAETSDPVPGVSVILKGTTRGTVTQINGEYVIDALPENEYLEFSFVGMKTQTVAIAGRERIDIVMQPDVVILHEWLVCGKSFLEPAVSASSFFPLIIGASLHDKKLLGCCNERYNLNVGIRYGGLFTNNKLVHSRVSINNINISKVRPGVAVDYNHMLLSASDKDTLISDYRVSLILNRVLKNVSLEAGAGRQSYNNMINTGFGGRISILNEFDNSHPKLTFAFHSGFWYWGDYNEYSAGLNLYFNTRKTITESLVRRINVGCEYKQINEVSFISSTIGVRFLVRRRVIGCG